VLVDVANQEMHAVIPRLKMQVVKQKNKSFELVEKSCKYGAASG